MSIDRAPAARRPPVRVLGWTLRLGPLIGLLVVAGLATLLADIHRRDIYTTSDEPAHVAAARQLRDGPRLVANFDHPVLVKLLAAVALAESPRASRRDDVVAARRLFPLLFGFLVLVAGTWTLARTSAGPAFLVAGLLTAEPTLRGHASLVHTDVPLTVFLVAAAAAVDLSIGAGRLHRRGVVLAGIFLGAALATKYSAVAFTPVFLALAAGFLFARISPPARTLRAAAAVGTVLAVALGVLALLQGWAGRRTTREELRAGVVRQFDPVPGARPRALAFVDSLPTGLGAYAAGVVFVTAFSGPEAGRTTSLLGELFSTSPAAYFPVALGAKLTTATVLLLPMAAAALFLALLRAGRRTTRRRRLAVAFVRCAWPTSLGAAYLAAAMASGLGVGVRHAIPAFVLLLIGTAGALETAFEGRRRILAGISLAFVGAAAVEAAMAAGREIPFGNVLVGGPAGVRRMLGDSNVYWGQGQERVFERIARGDLGRVGVLTGSFDVEKAIALRVRPVTGIGDVVSGSLDAVFVDASLHEQVFARNPNPTGSRTLEAVSVRLLPLVGELYRRALRIEPIGDEFLLFVLRPAGAPEPGGHDGSAASPPAG